MRRILLSFSVFLTIGLFFAPGSASSATLGRPLGPLASLPAPGPLTLPEIEVPASWQQPEQIRQRPAWLPANFADNATVILVPGTDDFDGADQYGRTVAIGMYDTPEGGHFDETRHLVIVNYPAAFGFTVLGYPVYLVGDSTYNDSVNDGTIKTIDAALAAHGPSDSGQKIILNGYSQSGPVAWNAAYLLHQSGQIPDSDIVVLLGTDTRFPNTGAEVVVPSFIPGLYTNGPRDESATGDIEVISYCVRGDSGCGLGNPLAHPFETAFYLLPGFYIHGANGNYVNQYTVIKTWKVDNTTYVVLDGGNPWGMMLRGMGIPVPPEFDAVLSALVPVPVPGEAATVAGQPVPTPRELQVLIYNALGLTVPTTDPDQNPDAWQAVSTSSTARTAATVTDGQSDDSDAAETTPEPAAETTQSVESPDTTANTTDDGTDAADKTDGDKADGDKTDGDKSDGDKTDGDKADSDKADSGDKTDGDKADSGDKTDSDKTDGDKTDGDKTESTTDSHENDGDHDSNDDASGGDTE
ncbi:PE-PPE domain-containing protein [Gordonia sp. ABSL49_1]|uniref:PE-PPE domain-containing protein n=1 Tax=Gordonia sp. ABSL49_1 TaxID=2920941 RepID=UPI001F10FE18|nr:PE-PPE domain-containing protein [Gordonia sp. ABSL49_1]MCH5641075.1 PE-PPE domain-containing protein [Gordonia sp. ABSL49_1]